MTYKSSGQLIRNRMARKSFWENQLVTHVHRIPIKRHMAVAVLARKSGGVGEVD